MNSCQPVGFEQPKIMLIGKNGQVGWELMRTLGPLGQLTAPERKQLNLADAGQIRRYVREIKPDIIINAAAYTDVDRAEAEVETATAVNAIAPGILAEEAKRLGALLVHYSTDFVFDGTKKTPYSENDMPNPLNVYARTKLAGEEAIINSGAFHLIFRVSWIYGLRRKNFMLTILRLVREHRQINVVNDQIGSPTWCRLIAEVTSLILSRDRSFLTEKQGIYHLSAQGQTSRYQFAKNILERCGESLSESVKLTPVSSGDFFTPARRPVNSLLSNEKLYQAFGLILPAWNHSFDLVVQQFAASEKSMRDF